MPAKSYELHGVRVLECEHALRNDRDAVELIPAVWENRAGWLVVPIECLDDDFFRLNTRIAGEIIQRFVTYRVRIAIVGDISRHLAESSALRDFVYESNRGEQVWFVPDLEALGERLKRLQLL
ncbi:MAG TPA: DUF4180 domain-containing protein [Bryobacteraceae bacterium]|nr:DUF4180 domain-containing protein [Bryobacteraceae bacterium]